MNQFKNDILITITMVLLISHIPCCAHPPPLQGGLIVAGGVTGESGLDSVEILDRYYWDFKTVSTSYES